MKIERKKSRGAEVYTASLNDIMFFLLLFFLIIATMATPMAIKVMLPKSTTSEQIAAKKTINVSVSHDRRYYVEDTELPFNEVEARLTQLAGNSTGEDRPNVLLQVDRAVDMQTFIGIHDICNRLKLKTTLIVEKDK